MNAYAVVGMNNTFSALINYTAAGVLEEHLEQLLCNSPDTRLHIPLSGVDVRGFLAVRDKILELYASEKGNAHLLHTAAYQTQKLPDGLAMGNWNTYSYRAVSRLEDGSAASVGYQFVRLTVTFVQSEGGVWKILSIYALPLMQLSPWSCTQPDLPGSMQSGGKAPNFDENPLGSIDPDDFVKLRNLAGFFTHYAPVRAMDYFAQGEDIRVDLLGNVASGYAAVRELFDRWAAEDERTGYLSRKLTVTNPVIVYAGDENHATLSGLGHVFDSEVLDAQQPIFAARRRVAAVHMSFVRQNGSWCIASLGLTPVLSLDREVNEHPRMLEAMPSRVPDYFPDLDPNHPGMDAGDVFEIESILPEWTERLKRGDLETFPDAYMVNGKEEIALSMRKEFRGYDAVMGRCHDLIFGQIGERLDMLRFPQFHSGCTPVIVSDGEHAQGIWTDIAWGNIGAAIFYEDSQKEREYLPGVGQYTHRFVKSSEGWRLYYLADRSEKVAPMIDWPYHIDKVGGWTVAQKPARWPLPFECE